MTTKAKNDTDEWIAYFDTPEGLKSLALVLTDAFGENEDGRGFSTERFPVAVTSLMDGRSQRAFAKRVRVSQSTLSRLIAGAHPDMQTMEAIAEALRIHPWFFVEWRAGFVSELVSRLLSDYPHLGVSAIHALWRKSC